MIDHSFLILIIVSRDVEVIVLDYCSLIGLLFRHRSKQKIRKRSFPIVETIIGRVMKYIRLKSSRISTGLTQTLIYHFWFTLRLVTVSGKLTEILLKNEFSET